MRRYAVALPLPRHDESATGARTARGDCPPARSQGGPVGGRAGDCDHHHMTMNRIRRALSGLVAEDRDGFKRVDASPVRPDDASWLATRRYSA